MPYTHSLAQAGRGSSISIGATPTLIGEITDIPLDLPKWDSVDVTNLESGSDQENLLTVRKSATFTVKGNRVSTDAGQVAVISAYQNATLSAFVVTLPKTATQTTTGDTYSFSAFVMSASFDVSPTKQVDFSMDLMTSGPVTFTAGS